MLTNIKNIKLKTFSTIIGLIICIGCGTANKKDIYANMDASKIYEQGKKHTHKKNYQLAIKSFEAIEARYPYGEYANKSHLALIYVYFKRGEHAQALAAANRFIKLNPTHSKVDYAHYMKGVINFDLNQGSIFKYLPIDKAKRDPSTARQAFDHFKFLIQHFPKSKYVADASKRLIYLKEQLARHELYIAEHYLDKGAYLSAANRCEYILKNFDATKSIPKALFIMSKSYKYLGMNTLASDAKALLQNNFPESQELKSLDS